MDRTRRWVVATTATGVVGLFAGCTGTDPSGRSSTTAIEDSSGPTTATTGEPSTVTGRDTATGSETATTQDRTSPNATGPSTTPSDSSTETTAPSGPTDPTTGPEIVLRNGDLTVVEVEVGPPGTDSRSIVREFVVFENTGSDSLKLTGYTVEYDGTGKSFEFPDSSRAEIPTGETARVTTGSGGATLMLGEHEFLAGFTEPVLKTDGGTIAVTNPDGETVLKARY